jgi:hypothetical protein
MATKMMIDGNPFWAEALSCSARRKADSTDKMVLLAAKAASRQLSEMQ